MSPAGVVHQHYHRKWMLPFFTVSTVLAGALAIYLAETNNFSLASYILEFWVWTNFWYYAGKILDPDLDLIGVTASEGRALRGGGLLGVLFYGYSSFYAALMYYLTKKFHIKGIAGAHRSWLTHSPLGTIIRIVFFNAPLAYLYQMISVFLESFRIFFRFANSDLLVFFAAQLLGLGIADAIHVYLDSNYLESKNTL